MVIFHYSIQRGNLKKISLTFLMSFFAIQFLFAQVTESEKKEVYPAIYTFEKAYEFIVYISSEICIFSAAAESFSKGLLDLWPMQMVLDILNLKGI